MSLARHKQDWEELARLDPLWAIVTAPEGKFGKWGLQKFFQTGEDEIRQVMEAVLRLRPSPARQTALDFGCGVGRLTRALTKYFDHCYGVDISESMVLKARELNGDFPACEFLVNSTENLEMFPSNTFDMIYTMLVLQHLSKKSLIKSYLKEFVRTLKPGGLLVFQLLDAVGWKDKLQPRRRAYQLLRTFGFPAKVLYEDLGLNPIRAKVMPEAEVTAYLHVLGAQILEVQEYAVGETQRVSKSYYVTK